MSYVFHVLFVVIDSPGADGPHRERVAALCSSGKHYYPVPASTTGPYISLQKGETSPLHFICKIQMFP